MMVNIVVLLCILHEKAFGPKGSKLSPVAKMMVKVESSTVYSMWLKDWHFIQMKLKRGTEGQSYYSPIMQKVIHSLMFGISIRKQSPILL